MPEQNDYDDFYKKILLPKQNKILSTMELRKDILVFFNFPSWRSLFEIRTNLVALGYIKKLNQSAYEVIRK